MKAVLKFSLVAAMALSFNTAYAKNCKVSLEANDRMQFDKKTITVAASCKEITVTLKHTGKLPKTAMGHNFVLGLTKDSNAIIGDGMKAGPSKGYTPKGKTVIAASKLIGGGESATVKFKTPKKGGDYTFLCTFPGHSGMMRGKFIVK
jgi:azurin